MTIEEMLAAGMSREDVAARLVKGRVAPDMANAYFMIALTLGETDGDVLNDEPSEADAVFLQRLLAIREQRATASGRLGQANGVPAHKHA